MGQLVFQAALGGAVNLIGPNISATTNFTLPGADGTNGQALTTNGSGVLGFSSIVSGAAGSNTQVQFNSGGNFGASANLTWDGTNLTSTGFSGPHNGTVGATTANTGNFTTLTTSSTVTLNGGTANGVTYLNGSKVLTSGSALTFDGSNFTVGGNAVFAKSTVTQSLGSTAGFAITDNSTTTMYLNNTSSAVSSMWSSGAIGIGTGSGPYIERVRIDTSGNVSLGFTSANAKLNIKQSLASTASGSALWITDDATTSLYANNVSSGLSAFWSSGSLAFGAASGTFTEGMRLTSTGLGIGTSSAVDGAKLSVYGNYAAFADGTYKGYIGRASDLATGGATSDVAVRAVGKLWLVAGSSGANSAVLDTAGNLGIGVTPSAWQSSYKTFQINSQASVSATSSAVYLSNNFYQDSGGTNRYIAAGAAGIAGWEANVFRWYQAASGAAGAVQTTTNSMTLDASGNLLVGTTSAADNSGVGIKSLYSATSPYMATVGSASSNGTVAYSLYSTGAAAFRFYVGYGGTVYATSTTITAISDQRLKENIRDLDEGLATVMALKPRKFDWKEGKGQNIKNARGFIAQEFETVLPDMIEEWRDPAPEGEEAYKAINANLIPTLVKAIQELKASMDAVKAEFDAYKASHP